MLDELVALAVPPRCAACRAPGRHAADVLCAACRRALPWLAAEICPRCALPLPHAATRPCPAQDAPFAGAWSAVAYDGRARDALIALKFHAARPLARVMAAQIAANAPPNVLPTTATLVPVPAHPRRRRARGFDAAELIAHALARRAELPLEQALRRGRNASRQLGATRQTRRAAGRLDFRARPDPPEQVVLVDDVHTTGATLRACANELRSAGTRQITVVTWARTLDDRRH
jgi:ComF family protein